MRPVLLAGRAPRTGIGVVSGPWPGLVTENGPGTRSIAAFFRRQIGLRPGDHLLYLEPTLRGILRFPAFLFFLLFDSVPVHGTSRGGLLVCQGISEDRDAFQIAVLGIQGFLAGQHVLVG